MREETKLIRFAELQPAWTVKRATEPGFLRWLVSWMGGPAGYVNFNPEQAAQSGRAAMGFMAMPQGNRQAGLHKHSVAEIYVILKGEIEGYDHTGLSHRAGPLDCIYIPAGVPHGVRTCGTQDLHLVWVHDAIERLGVSVYVDTAGPEDSDEHISIVRLVDQPPHWVAAPQGGLRWQVGFVGDGPGEVPNAAIRLGVTTLLTGSIERLEPVGTNRLLLNIGAEVGVRSQNATTTNATTTLANLDALHVQAGATATIWNTRDEPARLLWLEERASTTSV
jgi:mannose-6-phosphate isomerase-like protein (cupin superfamily)